MYGSDMFRGLFTALILLGVVIGGILFIVVPWLWRMLKPLIHSVTG